MSAAPSNRPGACACGMVIFDLSGRAIGDELYCTWCGNRYRFLGGEKMEPHFANSTTAPVPASIPATSKAAKPVRSATTIRNRTPHGPPGGMMPMIGFIIAFNALAIVALSFLFIKNADGVGRHAAWDESFLVAQKAIWPEIVALVLGNTLGFAAWALFAYRIHKKQLSERGSS